MSSFYIIYKCQNKHHMSFFCFVIFRKRVKYLIKPQGTQTFIIVSATGHSLTFSFSHFQQ